MAHILVVDDDKDLSDLARLVLEHGRHTVTTVSEPEQAVDEALRTKPDLVLLDVAMPRMDGFEVYRAFKADSRLEAIPISFLTSNNRQIDRMVGLHVMKADDYITKPFGKQELLDRVAALLKKNGAAL